MQRSEREPLEPFEAGAEAADLRTVRVRPRPGDPRMATATWIVALLVGLAIIKPWGEGSPGPSSPQPIWTPVPATSGPSPTQDRTADGLAEPICLGAGAWRVASLETWRIQDVRVWRAIEPIGSASGPLDPAIPSVPIVAVELGALGWCAPAYGPDKPVGPGTVTAWSVRGGTAVRLSLRQVRPVDGTTPIAALYLPGVGEVSCPGVTSCPTFGPRGRPVPWLTGRVVFRYVDEGGERVAWFAADIEILAPGPSGDVGPGPNVAP